MTAIANQQTFAGWRYSIAIVTAIGVALNYGMDDTEKSLFFSLTILNSDLNNWIEFSYWLEYKQRKEKRTKEEQKIQGCCS